MEPKIPTPEEHEELRRMLPGLGRVEDDPTLVKLPQDTSRLIYQGADEILRHVEVMFSFPQVAERPDFGLILHGALCDAFLRAALGTGSTEEMILDSIKLSIPRVQKDLERFKELNEAKQKGEVAE